MADISVLNTDSDLSAQTLLTAEGSHTITGAQTFDRDPNPPFVVTSGSSVVTNLDADKVDGKHSTDLLLLDGTQSMTGALNLGATGQLTFPATQNASAGVNVLDDYEEGTWTPSWGGATSQSGQVYATQSGRYIKIGRMVFCTAQITLTTLGTITGAVQIKGLPFTSIASAARGQLTLNYWTGMTTNWIWLGGYVETGTTVGVLEGRGSAGTAVANLAQADLSNATDVLVSLMYEAAN